MLLRKDFLTMKKIFPAVPATSFQLLLKGTGAVLMGLLTLAGCQREMPSASSKETPSESASVNSQPSPPSLIKQSAQGIVHMEEDGTFTLSDAGGNAIQFSLSEYQGENTSIVQEGAEIQVEYSEEAGTQPFKVLTLLLVAPPPFWAEYRSQAEDILSAMALEEKVGQLFFIRCPSVDAAEQIAAYHPGGILMFGQDFEGLTAEQTIEKIASYQQASAIPLLIGADEEGGTVARVSSNPLLRQSRFPSPQQLFNQSGMGAVVSDAEEKSRLLLSLGVNVNLAPVCDVSTMPVDFIYNRTLGQDAAHTAVYVDMVVRAMKKEGIGCVLKHFPGYGNNLDTHTGIAYDYRPLETFESSDFLPFQAGIQAGAGCVLVSHNIVSVMDSANPASLSPEVHRVLREKLGFQGVILTDDLSMDAVRMYMEGENAAVQAVAAGNDMLIVSDYIRQVPAVLQAVQDGRLDESLIDGAAVRVLCWKISLGLI